MTFLSSAGGAITYRSPLTKAALRVLRREWPMSVAFEELAERSMAEAGASARRGDVPGETEFLAGEMLTGMATNVIEWRLMPVPLSTAVDTMPAASPLARLQASQGYTK